uniref:Uncharacterized protein n=1 Tax=Oryza brachyantha TaxID=4533 RepID=J3LBG8_ORYBR
MTRNLRIQRSHFQLQLTLIRRRIQIGAAVFFFPPPKIPSNNQLRRSGSARLPV